MDEYSRTYQLAAKLDLRARILIQLILETCSTTEELTNIKTDDLDGQEIRLPGRRITLTDSLMTAIRLYMSDARAYLFSSRQSDQITTKRIRQIIADATEEMQGKKLLPKDLRLISLKKNFAESPILAREKSGIKNLPAKHAASEEDLLRIRSHISDRYHRMIFDVLLETGCVLKELVSIKVSDFHRVKSRITIRVSARNQTARTTDIPVALSKDIARLIKSRKFSPEDFLFSADGQRGYSEKRIFQIIKHYSRLAEISDFNPRTLRNSCISRMMDDGTDVAAQTGIMHLEHYHFGMVDVR